MITRSRREVVLKYEDIQGQASGKITLDDIRRIKRQMETIQVHA